MEGVGNAKALEIYRALGRGVALRLGAGADPGGEGAGRPTPAWTLEVHLAPDPELDAAHLLDLTRAWLEGIRVASWRVQEGATLGDRMRRALQDALARGAPATCVVASDVPELGPRQVEAAFQALGGASQGGPGGRAAEEPPAEVVLGPSPDGGYYLLGLRRAPGTGGWDPRYARLFTGIPWSTREVLSCTLERAREERLRVRTLEPLADVDEADDLLPGREGEGSSPLRESLSLVASPRVR